MFKKQTHLNDKLKNDKIDKRMAKEKCDTASLTKIEAKKICT